VQVYAVCGLPSIPARPQVYFISGAGFLNRKDAEDAEKNLMKIPCFSLRSLRLCGEALPQN